MGDQASPARVHILIKLGGIQCGIRCGVQGCIQGGNQGGQPQPGHPQIGAEICGQRPLACGRAGGCCGRHARGDIRPRNCPGIVGSTPCAVCLRGIELTHALPQGRAGSAGRRGSNRWGNPPERQGDGAARIGARRKIDRERHRTWSTRRARETHTFAGPSPICRAGASGCCSACASRAWLAACQAASTVSQGRPALPGSALDCRHAL